MRDFARVQESEMSQHAVSSRRSCGVGRLFRGWIVALLAVVLAAGGHQLAHSAMHGATEALPLPLLIFAAALTAPIAVALTGPRVAAWSTALTTLCGQLAFHALYSLPYTGASALPNGHEHHGPLIHTVATSASPIHDGSHVATAADTAMIVAHLLAAVLTIVVIVHGERCLITLAHWLTLTPSRLVLATSSVVTQRFDPRLTAGQAWIPHPMNVLKTRSTRGPPVLA